MTTELSVFAARLREQIGFWAGEFSHFESPQDPAWQSHADNEFSGLAIMLFTLQFKLNAAYRRWCEVRGIRPAEVTHWTEIPCVPTVAFKELELTCLHPEERTSVFNSSGTTGQRPSRHFHSANSLDLYEASLWPWLREHLRVSSSSLQLVSLTPPADQTPNSSLVHMFDFARRQIGAGADTFVGQVAAGGSWELNLTAALAALSVSGSTPLLVLGTAFSFVHLLDEMVARDLHLQLPAGSQLLETGGYKGRSRAIPKAELHRLIVERLGISASQILCEYGMSELSSQAYARANAGTDRQNSTGDRIFRFPPWARARVISPETGSEVAVGAVGLLQVFDLANAFSVLAVQTEDLVVRRETGFELLGRARQSEPRGCSLMSA